MNVSIFIILFLSLFLTISCDFSQKKDPFHSSMVQEEKVKYACPMHPQIISNQPGQVCSICGMNLVPIQEEEGGIVENAKNDKPEGREQVRLSEYKKQLIGIRTEKVIKRDLVEIISAPGRMAFDPELFTAQTEYIEALKQLGRVQNSPLEEVKKSTREMVHSAKTRLKVLGLSDSEIKKLHKTGSASRGLILGEGRQRLVYAEVFESELGKVRKGQKSVVRGNFGNRPHLEGEVIAVDQLIDPKSRTAKVRISITDENIVLPPQAFVSVDIVIPLGNHLSVSKSSILNNGKDTFVFKKVAEGEYRPVKVTSSDQTRDFAILYAGVSNGDQVVSKSHFLLDSESRLKSVFEKYKFSSKQESHSEHSH